MKSDNSSKNKRYVHLGSFGFFRIPVEYTIREKSVIASYFPKNNQNNALEDTSHHVSTLVSCLNSDIAPKNIKTKENIEALKEFYDRLQSLESILQELLNNPLHQRTIKIRAAFNRFVCAQYPEGSLRTLSDFLLYARLACNEVMRMPFKAGRKDPYHWEAIWNLAEVWKKYTDIEPTRKYDFYKQTRPNEEGRFIKYLLSSIEPAVTRYVKKKDNTRKDHVSISRIARDVIAQRASMAKNSSK